MNKPLIALGVLVVLVGGFFVLNSYIYNQKQADSLSDFGIYGYRCGDGTEFTISFGETIDSITVIPASNLERIPEVALLKVASATGARYEGEGIVFHAHGETVKLSTDEFSTTCNPIHSPDEAPFNFGD